MNPNVFIEAFLARLIPVNQEVTLSAIRLMKMEDYPINAALAGAGGLLAAAILYAIGIWLRRMPERVSNEEQRERIEAMRKGAHFWLPYLLVFSPTPVGGIIVIAAAFFRLKPALAWAVILLSELVFRAMPYMK